jgi:hypothetical protein
MAPYCHGFATRKAWRIWRSRSLSPGAAWPPKYSTQATKKSAAPLRIQGIA